MHKHIYKAGMKARRHFKSRKDNPYDARKQGIKHSTWDKGWRDEEAIVQALSPPEDLELAAAWRN